VKYEELSQRLCFDS